MRFASALFSYLGKFVVFKLHPIAHINTEGQQGNGNFGDNAGIVILDIGVVPTDINNSAKHGVLL